MTTHQLVIAGHRLTVRSKADPAYVQALARQLDERVRAVAAQGAGPVGSALLAALAIADELTRALEREEAMRDALRTRAAALAEALDGPPLADEEPPQVAQRGRS